MPYKKELAIEIQELRLVSFECQVCKTEVIWDATARSDSMTCDTSSYQC
jgi:ribosomal protein L31